MSVEIKQQFGWLEVVALAAPTARRQARYVCRCRCSREVVVLGYSLTSGIKRACGGCENELKVSAIFPKFTRTTIDRRGTTTRFAKNIQ
jgi:hypothetical protein